MMEHGACVSLMVKCHPLAYDRMQQVQTNVAHLAKVTGRSDCKNLFLDFNVLFCVFLPTCFCIQHFLFFSRCTRISVKHKAAVKLAAVTWPVFSHRVSENPDAIA